MLRMKRGHNMGCDIHTNIEVKHNGKWERLNWDKTHAHSMFRNVKELDKLLYIGRNYNLFAILANVRNGRGFAGTETGEGFNPISEPRGLPDDISEDTREHNEYWGEDAHSHSWLTLKEIVDFDWEQDVVLYGVVGEKGYSEFLKHGKNGITGYSAGVFGNTVETISNKEMDDIISGSKKRKENIQYYTQVEWIEKYKDCVVNFLEKTVPTLKKLSQTGDYTDVRLVFWFDN